MEKLIYERVQNNLERLKLIRIGDILEPVINKAQKKKLSYLGFLDQLLEEEAGAKESRRVQVALRTAGLPYSKTIDEYDFSFHPQLDKQMVMEIFDLSFIKKHSNVIFLGPPGVGKTHLAISLAIKSCQHGFSVCFTTMNDLMEKLRTQDHKRCKPLKASVTIVDEVGYLPIQRDETNLFFQFVSHRYEKHSTIFTSNKSFGDWQEFLGDPVIATAILDRLLHHCEVVNIKGHSYRLKNIRKEFLKNSSRKKNKGATADH